MAVYDGMFKLNEAIEDTYTCDCLSPSLPSAATNAIQGDKFTSSSKELFSPDLLSLAATLQRTCKKHTLTQDHKLKYTT